MVAAITDMDIYEKAATSSATIINIAINESSVSEWFNSIINETAPKKEDAHFKVLDRGNFIEFVLPRGTAQFTEMQVHDKAGKLVWKTQAFNKNIIRWYKQTTIGASVPQGSYLFKLRQGDRQVDGVANIA